MPNNFFSPDRNFSFLLIPKTRQIILDFRLDLTSSS